MIVQKGNIIDIYYEKSDDEVPMEEAEVVIMYLMDEGFIK